MPTGVLQKNKKQTNQKKKTSKKTPKNKKQKHVVDVHIQMKKISGVGVNNKMLSKMVFRIDMKVHVACIAIAEKRMHNPR